MAVVLHVKEIDNVRSNSPASKKDLIILLAKKGLGSFFQILTSINFIFEIQEGGSFSF